MRTIVAAFIISLLCASSSIAHDGHTHTPSPEAFRTVSSAGVSFSYANDAEFLYGILTAETLGWTAVGFDPQKKMQGANIIIGYVETQKDGKQVVHIRDDFATQVSKHEGDVELKWKDGEKLVSGVNNVMDASGAESAKQKITKIAFTIPLESGDPFDKILEPGKKYKIMLARGKGDNFTTKHTHRGYAEITLDPVAKK